ncbi:MAG: ZIP family metal transporter [Bacilli bacterium]
MTPLINTIFGICIIFAGTTLGSLLSLILGNKSNSKIANHLSLGFAAGIMFSASFFSLILPSIEMDVSYMPSYLLSAIGILLGALFLFGIDKITPHLHVSQDKEEGPHTKKISKIGKMFTAVTIHNIPEGLSVGIAYGVAWALQSSGNTEGAIAAFTTAMILAIGIAIQNVPEGAVVALPVLTSTNNKGKAFAFGTLSGAIEPIAALIGLFLAYSIMEIMPWALSFASGCMIYVVIEEMIPDFQNDSTSHVGLWAFFAGFILMMILDISLS